MDNNFIAAVVVSAFFMATSMTFVWICERVAAWRHDRKIRASFTAPWHPEWTVDHES